MKTFTSAPYLKALILAAIIFGSLAFRNPAVIKHGNKVAVKDTIPDTEININIDVSKMVDEVTKAIAAINFTKIMDDVQQSLQKINVQKMQAQIQESLRQVDF